MISIDLGMQPKGTREMLRQWPTWNNLPSMEARRQASAVGMQWQDGRQTIVTLLVLLPTEASQHYAIVGPKLAEGDHNESTCNHVGFMLVQGEYTYISKSQRHSYFYNYILLAKLSTCYSAVLRAC